jgi:hypothetical protein
MRASQRRFEFLIDALGAPTIVLIDDVDRCRAAFVVELVEGIQTLFLQRPVVYVVAADRDWLCGAYEQVYSDYVESLGDAGRPLGHLFLEKTFQISLEIPPLPEDIVERYWRDLVRGNSADGAEDTDRSGIQDIPDQDTIDAEIAATKRFLGLSSFEEVIAALDAAPESQKEAWRRAAMRRLSSTELERDLEHALEPYAHLLERNPRSMKRLINAYGIEHALRIRTGVTLRSDARAQNVLWTIVRLRWPLLADHLTRYPEHADILATKATLTDFDYVPDSLRPLFIDRNVRRVFEGEGVGIPLDAESIGRFLRTGHTPSTVGA